MIILDQPFVSNFLINTIKESSIPVLNRVKSSKLNSMTDQQAIELCSIDEFPTIYTNSENAIDWIDQNLTNTSLPTQIRLFKDKYEFRKLLRNLYPDFHFKSVAVNDLESVDFKKLPVPFIIKPCVGFFSMGVYKVNSLEEWNITSILIRKEMQQVKGLYPTSVMGDEQFIIEQCIDGEEFAVDAYINTQGQAIVLSILKHTFSSKEDVSDRVYTTSKDIIESNLTEFTNFTQTIADLSRVKNFPMHIELRRDANGKLFPIEVNPMRFGGWCSTADMSFYAFGFNQYLYYLNQQKPNWNELLKNKRDKQYSVIVLDNSTGIASDKIQKFDFEKVKQSFQSVLESRIIDFHHYPLFGFLFVETENDNSEELKTILSSDLSEYVTLTKT